MPVVGFDLFVSLAPPWMFGQRPLKGPDERFSAKARAASWNHST
jgi:hypothetical protein